jgi:hypothetical protein
MPPTQQVAHLMMKGTGTLEIELLEGLEIIISYRSTCHQSTIIIQVALHFNDLVMTASFS